MGMRLRLKSSYDISSFSQQMQVILTAMKTYGLILADNGSALYVTGVSDNRWGSDLDSLKSVPASAFEAVAGAVFLDLGYEAAQDWLTAIAEPELASDAALGSLKSPKSRLQEHTQRLAGERPAYRLVEVSGPDHERVFRIEVSVGGVVVGQGEGPSRRIAETLAAGAALETLSHGQSDLVAG